MQNITQTITSALFKINWYIRKIKTYISQLNSGKNWILFLLYEFCLYFNPLVKECFIRCDKLLSLKIDFENHETSKTSHYWAKWELFLGFLIWLNFLLLFYNYLAQLFCFLFNFEIYFLSLYIQWNSFLLIF